MKIFQTEQKHIQTNFAEYVSNKMLSLVDSNMSMIIGVGLIGRPKPSLSHFYRRGNCPPTTLYVQLQYTVLRMNDDGNA